MVTQIYKEKLIKISPRFWIIALILLLAINAAAAYLYFSTYSKVEDVSSIELSGAGLTSGGSSQLPGDFDANNRPSKAFNANNTYRDIISGITIRYPQNWQVKTLNNLILIKEDACGTRGALLYPALYRSTDITPEQLSQEFIKVLNNLPGIKNKLQFGEQFLSGTSATSLISGEICSKNIQGQLEAIVSGDQAQVRLFWGPPQDFDNLRLAWNDVFTSFSPNTSAQYLEIQGENFEAGLPDDWDLEEQEDGLNITTGDKRVTFRSITSEDDFSDIVDNFMELISVDDEDEGDVDDEELFEISDLETISEKSLDMKILGLDWQVYIRIFDFTSQGKKLRSQIVTARPKDTGEVLLSMRQSLESNWVADTSELMSIEESLRIKPDSASPRKALRLPLVSPITGNNFAESIETSLEIKVLEETLKLDSLILGYARVRSNDLNKEFWAPLSQRQADGTFKRTLSNGQEEELQIID